MRIFDDIVLILHPDLLIIKNLFCMFIIEIPGHKKITIKHLVLDFNGTLAISGQVMSGVHDILNELSHNLKIHIITADTFGTVREQMSGVNCEIITLENLNQQSRKLEFVQQLGTDHVAAVGNGSNDSLMLKHCAISIALIQGEGAAVATLQAAEIVCTNIIHALELFKYPERLIATLRK